MSAQQYVRVDLWRYIKVEDKDIRSSFKFTVFIVNYIFYFILLLSLITVILSNVNIKVNLLVNLMVCIIVSYIREGNVMGNTIIDICSRRWRHTYGITSGMYIYNTRKAERDTRKLVSFIYTFIFVLLIMLMLDIFIHIGFASKLSIAVFSIIFYAFVYWMHPKTIKRKLNLIFGA